MSIIRKVYDDSHTRASTSGSNATRRLGARTLLGAPGIATRNKKLLGAKGIAIRSKDATRRDEDSTSTLVER